MLPDAMEPAKINSPDTVFQKVQDPMPELLPMFTEHLKEMNIWETRPQPSLPKAKPSPQTKTIFTDGSKQPIKRNKKQREEYQRQSHTRKNQRGTQYSNQWESKQ